MKRQGVTSIERGDVVLFYTGWTKLIGKDNKRYGSVEPGLGVEGAKYLAERWPWRRSVPTPGAWR